VAETENADLVREGKSVEAPPALALGRIPLWREVAPWAVFLIAFGLMPVLFSYPYQHNIAVLICLTALMATGWNLLGGFTGQISLGHALFFGIGAYTVAAGSVHFGLNPWIGMLLSAVIAVAVSMVIGLPVFRLRGHYFAIATIAIGEIAFLIFLNWRFVGAARGLSIDIKPDSVAELQFSGQQKWEYYYLAAGLLLLALAATRLILRSRTGYYLIAIREDQEAAASVGVPVARYKQIALSFSAGVVAVAGGFFAQFILFVDPDSAFGLAVSIQITIAAVLGGVKSMWGPVIGATVLVALTETARLYLGGTGNALNLVVYGLLVMVIAAFEPNGLIGLAQRFTRVVVGGRG
jgi:branched-chain amino acid transport system permease protein